MKELKILNAKIPDFETDTWEVADILIDHGTILKVGTVDEDTLETIDAEGKIASPGLSTSMPMKTRCTAMHMTFSQRPVRSEWALRRK